MIDTDKYEGHTEGPWHVVTHEDIEEWGDDAPKVEGLVAIKSPNPSPLTVAFCDNRWQMDGNGFEERLQHSTTGATAREMFNANEQLIADAPLLLAEVKRLRERLIRAYDWVEKVVHGDDSVMADYTEYVCGDEEE